MTEGCQPNLQSGRTEGLPTETCGSGRVRTPKCGVPSRDNSQHYIYSEMKASRQKAAPHSRHETVQSSKRPEEYSPVAALWGCAGCRPNIREPATCPPLLSPHRRHRIWAMKGVRLAARDDRLQSRMGV